MTLLPQDHSPLNDVWVSLDLETTGLSSDSDEIIEVGAVKFRGDETLDTFQSLVNPHRTLDGFIKRYTGISQDDVDGAPPFARVSRDLAPFLGSAPIVGHNIAFDLGFLASKGMRLSNPRSDTWDLGFVLLPGGKEYSLAKLAASLGIDHPRPHRAVQDAQVTRDLFVKLVEMASELDVYTLAEMERLASRSSWVLSYLLRRVAANGNAASPSTGAMGFDVKEIRERLKHARVLRPNRKVREVDVDRMAGLLSGTGRLAETMSGFEERPQQIAMARAVADAINQEKSLIVEAGTGVGKSLAYLLPAALHALTNNARVVISTNTINLQEQLVTKDVPALVNALAGAEDVPAEELKFTLLKGRANYLCLKRWQHLRSGDSLSDDEARLLSKALVWMGTTGTGDRSELNLANRNAGAPWDRMSAQGARDCTGVNGVCFLRAARDRAAAAHIVIVNHALLMSDLTAGRALIPDYDVLIVDEAHHLEEEATKHLSFELRQDGVDDLLQSITGDGGLLNAAVTAFRGSTAADTRRCTVEEVAGRITAAMPAVRNAVATTFGFLTGLVDDIDSGGSFPSTEKRVTSATRSQPGWSQLEIQWENGDLSLSQLGSDLQALSTALDGLDNAGLVAYDGLTIEVANTIQQNTELRQQLKEFIPQPESDRIYWTTRARRTGDLILHAAPLHVGEQLDKHLFGQKKSVILTGATLSTRQNFEHIRHRTGFNDTDELLLGSPFDYPNAALLCVPEDMPEPASWAYQPAVEQAVTDATVAADGRTMALFTSHAGLQATAKAVRGSLQVRGFDVLAQGIDGTPHRLVQRFLDNPRSVLLGTASFWEGVDLAGDSLRALLVAKLPFNVPTEPVFEARSELYEDAFNEYAVPQAVLRIRQGFGRLIRTRADRGVVAILDRRVLSRGYGKAFLNSLPPVSVETHGLLELGDKIRGWLARPA